MVKVKELRDMSVEELEQAEKQYSRELFDLRNDFMQSKKAGKHRVRATKKDRARALTILTEKRMNKQSGR